MSEPAESLKKVILVGATGATGKEVLAELLRTDHFAQVYSFGRRPCGQTHPKLAEQIVDFEKLADGDEVEAKKFKDIGADAAIITLGTTRADAGSASRFERIDREYVVAAAKAARDETKAGQRLVYLCSAGANAKAPSFLLYPRSKGLTELALADIAYPSSYTFRPGFLYRAERSKPRLMETIFGFLTHNVLSRVLSGAEIHVRLLAKSIVATAAEGDALLASKSVRGVALRAVQDKGANMTIVSNLEAIRLAR